MADRSVRLSKVLSLILRHRAHEFGLKLDDGGFANLSQLLELDIMRKSKYTVDEVKAVVQNNDKQRFSLQDRDGELYIRANQGHSIAAVKVELKPITLDNYQDYPVVVHGTYMKSWPAIKASGLSKMARNHIHFAQGEYGSKQVISGMRRTCQVLIYINLKAALEDNIQFHLSENGVVLSEGVNGILAPKYFSHVLRTSDLSPFDPDFPEKREESGTLLPVGANDGNNNNNSQKTKAQKRNERRKKKSNNNESEQQQQSTGVDGKQEQ